ncbi:hypothetical protein [Kineosporia sp. A_224]|uniref:hypothetical protein n=1 Tax=Kineosporia sp. A_224 TaxID=1962180 RepID=UPI000B4BC9CD|nr:hypothetical protein [Kineosporia sp. A_224]
MPTIDDDARGVLDRLLLLALEDAADRTYRLHAGAPAPFVSEVLCAELEVDGFLDRGGSPRLSEGLRAAVARAAAEISAGRRPGGVLPQGRDAADAEPQRSTER